MRLPPFAFTVLDTETTGFTPRVNHVIEFASMRIEGGKVVDSYEHLLSVAEEIPAHIQVLTRIKNEDIKGKPTCAEKREEILEHIGPNTMIVGQNLAFDIGMLKGEGIDLSERPWVDTSLLASLVFPELRSYSLGYLSRVLDLDHAPVHRALGDVKATYELFVKIWERLSDLPSDLLQHAKVVMGKSSPGYAALFQAIEDTGSKDRPSWMTVRARTEQERSDASLPLPVPPIGTVHIQEEALAPGHLQAVVNACAKDTSAKHWIAVKNLDHAMRMLALPEGLQVLHPPFQLLDTGAAQRMIAQETYTIDEALLSLKLQWFSPRTRHDLALHGGEKDVWNGKLACTNTSEHYVTQFSAKANVYLLDQRQLFSLLKHGETIAANHIILDDASMLEDTATKAFGAECSLDDLRAAAQGDEALMRTTDILNLWAEKVRANEDQHFLTEADMDRPETRGIRDQVADQLTRTDLPEQTRRQLESTLPMFQKENVKTHVMWIELRQNGSISLHAMPERIDQLLDDTLYSRFPVTLLSPLGCDKSFPETIPPKRARTVTKSPQASQCQIASSFPEQGNVREILRNPPAGKTMILLGSKRLIEQYYVEFAEAVEANGVTMICQGLSGGQNRMEAEFIAAAEPAVWLLTPWTYEGTDLPLGTLDRLILDTLPFDHPGQPLMQKRKDHYRNSFSEYAMPRVEYRLFRLIRTFCRHRKEQGDLVVLDKRIHEKEYGRQLRSYIERFGSGEPPKKQEKKEPVQPSLF